MVRTSCFSCGSAVPDGSRQLAALCPRCASAGRQVPRERLRWNIRTLDGGSRGPFGHDAVVDQLLRGALQPEDRVARVGGDWARLCEHPDFRRQFLPGTPEALRMLDARETGRKDRSGRLRRERARLIGAGVLMLGSLLAAVLSAQSGLLVIPEEHLARVEGFFHRTGAEIGGQLAAAMDSDAALEAARQRQEIPGEALVKRLQARWPEPGAPAALLFANGNAALWKGTRAGATEAKEHFEKALAASPQDPEAAAGLARALALLDHSGSLEAEEAEAMIQAAGRAGALAPDSPSSLVARAAVARATEGGNALELLAQCGEPAEQAGQPGSTVDLSCAILRATVGEQPQALEALEQRFAGLYPIRFGRAEVALAREELREAITLARQLSQEQPEEPGPWRILLDAGQMVGDLSLSYEAAGRLAALDPDRLSARQLLAEIELKGKGRPEAALASYEALIAHPDFSQLADEARLLSDAAAAAIAAGQPERGLALAEQALQKDGNRPGPTLHKARALQALGQGEAARLALRAVDGTRLSGHAGARYHVGAARIYMQLGETRQAVSELHSAAELDPGWAVARLESARAALELGNLPGAIESIESIAFLDRSQDLARSPLQAVWTGEPDWRALRQQLERQLEGDARFAVRGPSTVAILAWYAGMDDSRSLLKRALEGGPGVPAARAAMAQQALQEGRYAEAHSHAEQVPGSEQDLTVLYAVKGRALAGMGQGPQAEAEFKKALDGPRPVAAVHRWLAEARAEAGRTQEARQAYRDALKIAPDDIRARAALLDLRENKR